MKIDVYTSHLNIGDNDFTGMNAVMVDVFRASTSIITALYNGCKSIVPEEEIEHALNSAKSLNKEEYLLAGERHGVRIDGFDLGNSPIEYTAKIVADRKIFLTTSNGTRTIKKAVSAARVYVGGFVNLNALAKRLIEQESDIAILCAGTNGCFSLEDILFAGALIKEIDRYGIVLNINDLGLTACSMYESAKGRMDTVLSKTKHYKHLDELGFCADIKYCLEYDIKPVIPEYRDGEIVLS